MPFAMFHRLSVVVFSSSSSLPPLIHVAHGRGKVRSTSSMSRISPIESFIPNELIYGVRTGPNMCVKCTRCSRPFYCQARLIEARRDYWLSSQRILDVGIKRESALYAEDCEYNYSTVTSCTMCVPNSTAHQEVDE